MDDQLSKQHLEILLNPPWPSSSMSHDYGVLARDIPPRRTLREKVAAIGWYRRHLRAERRAEREAAARARD